VTRRDQGQATVELAMSLPLVAVVLLSVLQVAALARDHVLVAHAAREAARAVAVGASRDTAAAVASRSSGLPADRLDVTVRGSGPAGSRRFVQIRYRSATDVPLVGTVLGDVELGAEVTIRAE
jgi:hypothetical protein